MKPRQKKFVMVLVPASLFLAWRLIALVSGPSTPASASAALAEAGVQPEQLLEVPHVATPPQLVVSQAVLDLQSKRAKLAWGRDPFASRIAPMPTSAPAVVPVRAPAAPPWMLTGISRAGGNPRAILAGRIVSAGDRIADRYDVVTVSDREVVIRDGDWVHHFTLGVKGAQTAAVGEDP